MNHQKNAIWTDMRSAQYIPQKQVLVKSYKTIQSQEPYMRPVLELVLKYVKDEVSDGPA